MFSVVLRNIWVWGDQHNGGKRAVPRETHCHSQVARGLCKELCSAGKEDVICGECYWKLALRTLPELGRSKSDRGHEMFGNMTQMRPEDTAKCVEENITHLPATCLRKWGPRVLEYQWLRCCCGLYASEVFVLPLCPSKRSFSSLVAMYVTHLLYPVAQSWELQCCSLPKMSALLLRTFLRVNTFKNK